MTSLWAVGAVSHQISLCLLTFLSTLWVQLQCGEFRCSLLQKTCRQFISLSHAHTHTSHHITGVILDLYQQFSTQWVVVVIWKDLWQLLKDANVFTWNFIPCFLQTVYRITLQSRQNGTQRREILQDPTFLNTNKQRQNPSDQSFLSDVCWGVIRRVWCDWLGRLVSSAPGFGLSERLWAFGHSGRWKWHSLWRG